MRAVLLHELIHLRRRDVWLNFLQALLQIFYWWHPLVWLANARIRRVREEAVDDAVMLALRDEARSLRADLAGSGKAGAESSAGEPRLGGNFGIAPRAAADASNGWWIFARRARPG